MLQLVNPYVTYGEVNLKAIRELVYKRGYAKVDGQRIPITDNALIEKLLGKYGIICESNLYHPCKFRPPTSNFQPLPTPTIRTIPN